MGSAQLYNTVWKLVIYVNISKLDEQFGTVKQYAVKTKRMCQELKSESSQMCLRDIEMMETRLEEIQDRRELLKQIIKVDDDEPKSARIKRGVFNFIGQASKFLFGTLDENDANYYQEKINQVEQEQLNMLKVAREQMTVVRSTLQTINSTFYKVALNEQKLKESLKEIVDHVNNETLVMQAVLRQTSLEVIINRHFIELESCIVQVREHYKILIDAVLNAQRGILQPEVMSPGRVIRAFQRSRSNFPKDLTIPVTLSMAQGHALLKISDVHIFVKRNILSYVIETPLVNNIVYNMYQLIPFPTPTSDSLTDFIFIESAKDYLLIDETKQTYVLIDKEDLAGCKKESETERLCKQTFPLMYTHTSQECVVSLLNSNEIPQSCVKKIIRVNELIMLPIDRRNEWIYVAPRTEKITVMCGKEEPTDTTIQGVGTLIFYESCQCYSSKTKIVSQAVVKTNETRRDFVPELILSYDCCEHLGSKITLSEVKLEEKVPLMNVLSNVKDLKYASYKVDEVEELIEEAEAKVKQNEKFYYTSILSYLGVGIAIIMVCCCCCRYCDCCRSWRKYWRDNSDCCGKLCFHQTIVNAQEYEGSPIRSRPPINSRTPSPEISEHEYGRMIPNQQMTPVTDLNERESIEMLEQTPVRVARRHGRRY